MKSIILLTVLAIGALSMTACKTTKSCCAKSSSCAPVSCTK